VSRRASLAAVPIALAVAVLGPQSGHAAIPTLYVHYAMNCTFTIVGDNGGPVTSIPPGAYQVLVTSPEPFAAPDLSGETDPNVACSGSLAFRLTGPGVSLFTTLEDGDASSDLLSATFQAGTYVAQEDRRPTLTRTSIAVTAGAASTGGSGGGGSGGGSANTSTTKTATPTTKLAVRGTLKGSVSTKSKLTLTLNGRKVSSLKSGRYTVSVLDETSRSGFTIQRLGKAPTQVTGKGFLGRHAVTVSLVAGQWFYYSPAGKKTYFVVVA
jgi:hypothetical protein